MSDERRPGRRSPSLKGLSLLSGQAPVDELRAVGEAVQELTSERSPSSVLRGILEIGEEKLAPPAPTPQPRRLGALSRTGWICPLCRSGVAPHVSVCPCAGAA